MTQGRKPNPMPVQAPDEFDRSAPALAPAVMNDMAVRSTEIAQRYGDGTPYNRSQVVSEARFYMGQSAEAMLEAGKRLIQLKENEPHGEFAEIITERLGINERTARVMMQAAAKYLAPQLEAKRQTFAVLGRSKLFELMTESDDDLAELADGGTLAGHSLPEIAAMTNRELKKALADERKTVAAKQAVIDKKNKKIDDLDEQINRRYSKDADDQLTALRDVTLEVELGFDKLLTVLDTVMNAPASEAVGLSARQTLDYLAQHLADACERLGIALNLEEKVIPLQMRAIREAAAAGRKPS